MTIKNQIAPQKCKRCGAIFVRRKSTAKYCSGTCREAYNHQERKKRRKK